MPETSATESQYWECHECDHVFAHPVHTDPDRCENCRARQVWPVLEEYE